MIVIDLNRANWSVGKDADGESQKNDGGGSNWRSVEFNQFAGNREEYQGISFTYMLWVWALTKEGNKHSDRAKTISRRRTVMVGELAENRRYHQGLGVGVGSELIWTDSTAGIGKASS